VVEMATAFRYGAEPVSPGSLDAAASHGHSSSPEFPQHKGIARPTRLSAPETGHQPKQTDGESLPRILRRLARREAFDHPRELPTEGLDALVASQSAWCRGRATSRLENPCRTAGVTCLGRVWRATARRLGRSQQRFHAVCAIVRALRQENRGFLKRISLRSTFAMPSF
jgi:hypothetical protein